VGFELTWTAFPDRDADRFRLVVLYLAAGVPVVIGLAVPVLLAFAVANGLAVENVGRAVLAVVLALIGGPASLVYLLLAVEYSSEREVQKLTPSIGWFRLRTYQSACSAAVSCSCRWQSSRGSCLCI